MFQLFVPTTKVQKDRVIMRETDARVAKYSRRGLILNFIVFALCLAFGDFFEREHTLAIVLITGLLLVTLLRSYYLFRFDVLYARAPARWRNQYFVASCLGAAWWSIILVSLTWVQGMRDETLIMWLYSVVFYSSVANVFAPYRQFLTLYLFIGQVPAAITAILLGNVEGYLYGSIMLMFFIMISHQAKVTSITYWERLEANFALHEHARGLEHEQRSSKEAIELKNEFLVNLGQEFRSSLSDILGTLTLVDDAQLSERQRELLTMASKAGERQLDLVNNVVDFSKITTKTLKLEDGVFDLRRALEKLVLDFSLDAHQQGVELYYFFDPEMPLRVRGDVARLGQILSTLLNHALKNTTIDHVFVEARFNTDLDEGEGGELQVVISDSEKATQRGTAEQDALKNADEKHTGIGLSICKGLAACMGGSVHLMESKERGNRVFINIKLEVVSHHDKRFGAEQKLRGKRALLVDLPENTALVLNDELNVWGMHTTLANGYDQALLKLKELSAKTPIDLILIYTKLNSMNALVLSKEIASNPQYADITQIIVMSILQSDTAEMKAHLLAYPQVTFIEKPIMRKRLYDVALSRLLDLTEIEEDHSLDARELHAAVTQQRILLVDDHRVDQMVISAMLKKMGYYVQVATDGAEAVEILEKEKFHLVLMDYDSQEPESLLATQKIRASEKASHVHKPLPIVAVTSGHSDTDQANCLAAGMDDQIAKPIRYDELEARLERWLE
jgi:CheY-like chemotaxis protein